MTNQQAEREQQYVNLKVKALELSIEQNRMKPSNNEEVIKVAEEFYKFLTNKPQ